MCLDPGMSLLITGPSGAGKSSLMRAIAGELSTASCSLYMDAGILDLLMLDVRSMYCPVPWQVVAHVHTCQHRPQASSVWATCAKQTMPPAVCLGTLCKRCTLLARQVCGRADRGAWPRLPQTSFSSCRRSPSCRWAHCASSCSSQRVGAGRAGELFVGGSGPVSLIMCSSGG